MIINTGMRTDIPAFYSDWFVNRLKAGLVLVRNPYNPRFVTRYRLSPDVVDLIGFCTKNPAPMLPHMDLLRPYGRYWFVTITPYGKNMAAHDPESPLLIGQLTPEDQVHEAKQESWIDPQMMMEL